MSAVVIAPDIAPDVPETIELVDDQTFVFQPAFARGYTQRASFGDPRWRVRRRYSALRARDRTRLLHVLNEARGAHRVVYLTPAQTRLGSFPSSELFTNTEFQGVTGWTAVNGSLSESNGVLRVTRERGSTDYSLIRQNLGLSVQYAPYALRALAVAPTWPVNNTIGPFIADSVQSANDYQIDRGLRTASIVALSTASDAQYPVVAYAYQVQPGHYVDLHFTSLARCALIDNGPNRFLQSDAIDNASWNKSELTVTTGATGPDDDTTADTLTPTTVNAQHVAYQIITGITSNAVDICIAGAFKANGYNFVQFLLTGSVGSARQMFNLSTGALGVTAGAETGWSNNRAFIVNWGDGWYYCALVARKTNSDTSISANILIHSSDSAAAYAGDGTSGIRAFRPAVATSAVPIRLTSTTTSSVPNGTAQTGGALHLKGLPASTNGLLLAGDWVEINGQLKMVTAALNSDAAGRGILYIRPGLHRGTSDNDPVIVTKPMGRFLLRNGAQWGNRYGHYVDADLVFDEVYT